MPFPADRLFSLIVIAFKGLALTNQSAPRSFASDNFAPVHPTVMQAIIDSNQGHAMAYGGDDYSARAVPAFTIACSAPRSAAISSSTAPPPIVCP